MGPIKTHARSSTILPHFIGLDFDIYNGKTYGRVTLLKVWLGINLVNLLQHVNLKAIQAARNN